MSWEFDYKKTYRELAIPAYTELGPKIHSLVSRVTIMATNLNQNSNLDVTWPEGEDELKAELAALGDVELAYISEVVYNCGHWYSSDLDDTGLFSKSKQMALGASLRKPGLAWLSPSYAPDKHGGYWKFQKLVYGIGDVVRVMNKDKGLFSNLKERGFYTHKDGTGLCSDELVFKFKGMFGDCIDVTDVISVNFKVDGNPGHPFMVGTEHLKGSGMYLDQSCAPCAHCGCPYDSHTSELAMVMELKRDCTELEIRSALKPMIKQVEDDGIAGFAFKSNRFTITNAKLKTKKVK